MTSSKNRSIWQRLRVFFRLRPSFANNGHKKEIIRDEPVFGCNLIALCHKEKQNIPKFVKQCIEAIEKKDLKEEGIYRVCGNFFHVQKIMSQVNKGHYSCIRREEDVHVLAGVLKLFFREMKEPLFPCHLLGSLMEAICLTDEKEKFDAIYKLVKDLPPPNYETLKYLFQHLLKVKDHCDENLMHIQNLSMMFGPALIRPICESNDFAYDMLLRMHSNELIEFLLLEYTNIFE